MSRSLDVGPAVDARRRRAGGAPARARGDGRLLAGGRTAPQGRLGAHQAGGGPVGAEPSRALGRAAARRRQGADARDAPRRQGDLPPPRRGRRADVGSDRQAPGVRQDRAAQDPFPGAAPPAGQRLRAGLDRRGGAPLRPRDGRPPRRSARPLARRRDLAPPGTAAGGGPQHPRAQGADPGHSRPRRARAAAAAWARQHDHGDLRPAAVEADRRPAQAVRGGRRARRAGRAPRRRLLRRLPARQDLRRSVPVADALEGLVFFPVQEVALATAQRADLRGEKEGAADRRDHDGDQRPERHVRSLYRPRFECQTRRRAVHARAARSGPCRGCAARSAGRKDHLGRPHRGSDRPAHHGA